MKKQKILKILKYLLILVSMVLIISLIYNIIKYIRTGNQELILTSSSNYYTNSKLEALAEVSSDKTIEKGKIKARLLDSDDKKVKGIKGVFNIDENDTSNISLDIPKDLEPGGYTLELTLSTNLRKRCEEKKYCYSK